MDVELDRARGAKLLHCHQASISAKDLVAGAFPHVPADPCPRTHWLPKPEQQPRDMKGWCIGLPRYLHNKHG